MSEISTSMTTRDVASVPSRDRVVYVNEDPRAPSYTVTPHEPTPRDEK